MNTQTFTLRDPKPLVLIVEDDELLRALMVEVVTDADLRVEAVSTADAGLRAFEACPHIGLLLTDVRTPGILNGWDLAKTVCDRNPDVPVIITSGYCFEASSDLPCSASFIAKPWSLDQLCDLVKARILAASQ